jgi:outer membrane protein assembly factor BamE (lipoprotein component of BamABCDE complex)
MACITRWGHMSDVTISRKPWPARLSILTLALCLWACGTGYLKGAGRDFDPAEIRQIVKGTTTQDQIVAMFGVPFSKTPEVNGERWAYSYAEVTINDSKFDLPETGVIGHKKDLNILFNDQKVVINYTFNEGPIYRGITVAFPGR